MRCPARSQRAQFICVPGTRRGLASWHAVFGRCTPQPASHHAAAPGIAAAPCAGLRTARLKLATPARHTVRCGFKRRLNKCSGRLTPPCAENMRAATEARPPDIDKQTSHTVRHPQKPTARQEAKPAPLRPPQPPPEAPTAPQNRSVTAFANPRHTGREFVGAQGPGLKESLCAPPNEFLNDRSLPLGLEKERIFIKRKAVVAT